MQLALAAGSTGRGTSDFLPNARTNRLLAAGVVLAGAGVIAVNPVAPLVSVASHHQPAVELTATTEENLDYLMGLLSGPNPLSTAINELTGYYSQVASNSFDGMMAGIEGAWSGMGAARGLETILPQIMDYLQQGDFTHAWDLINWDLLFSAQNIFQPLFDHTVRGTGEFVPGVFGLGADMTRVWAEVQDIFGDFNFWKSTAKYLTEPLTGYMFALSENLNGVEGREAQDPIDALLNGYITWNEETGEDTGQWWGLLTPQGTFAYFLDVLPSRIADALTANIPDVDAGDAVAAASLFDFDLDWLTGLFT